MWFDVDKSGLAAMLESRGKSFAVFELVQNAWDSGAANVSIAIEPIPGSPYATLTVEDDSPEGWADLADAFTMFKRSRRAGDATKRGRFCLGEKLVLSLCRSARIATTTGAVIFGESGRRQSSERRECGTLFSGEIRMTRGELAEVAADARRLIPPINCRTTFNGDDISPPIELAHFDAKLPTVVAGDDGIPRKAHLTTVVQVYPSHEGGEILEMGIPICEANWPWRLNVQQKVPLNMERDSVTEAFRRALQVAAVNAMAETIDPEQAAQPWAAEAIGDARIAPDALKTVIVSRFGDKAVVATPGDPMANASAEAMGCQVLHGGSLSADAWANLRKHQTIPTTAQAYPSPKPKSDAEQIEYCPTCKREM